MSFPRLSLFSIVKKDSFSEDEQVENFLFALAIQDEKKVQEIVKNQPAFKKTLYENLERLDIPPEGAGNNAENLLFLKPKKYSTELVKAYAAALACNKINLLNLFNKALESKDPHETKALQSFALEVYIYLKEKQCAIDLKSFCDNDENLQCVDRKKIKEAELKFLRYCHNLNILSTKLKTAKFLSNPFKTDFDELRFDFLMRLKSAIKKLNPLDPALADLLQIIKNLPKFYANYEEGKLPELFNQIKEQLAVLTLDLAKKDPKVHGLIIRYADQCEKLAAFLANNNRRFSALDIEQRFVAKRR